MARGVAKNTKNKARKTKLAYPAKLRARRLLVREEKPVCRICKKEFMPTSIGKQFNCKRCMEARPFCECGCGKRVKSIGSGGAKQLRRFVSGHQFRGLEKSEEQIKSWRKSLKSVVRICRWCGDEFHPSSGVQKSCGPCLHRPRLCECGCGSIVKPVGTRGFRPPKFLQGHHSKTAKFRAISSKRSKSTWEKMSAKEQLEKLNKMTKGRATRPNNAERKLDKLLASWFPSEYRMNVCGDVRIGGKIPDFVNVNGKKSLVELFGNYWHGKEFTGTTEKKHEAMRKKHFSKWGYSTVVVWEKELRDVSKLGSRLRKEFLEEPR
jgi:G:T-mismatch repair DNA endonuclease (very short patch repair protein)